jgi:hypothetical protein
MTFTWISKLRGEQSGGRQISLFERRLILAAAAIGVTVITGWVVFRYSTPIPADRVAWMWVRQVVHQRPDRAMQYTLPSFEQPGSDGQTTSETASKFYSGWVDKYKANYTLNTTTVSSDGKCAEVSLAFRFLDSKRNPPVTEKIVLLKQRSGEWKVARKCGAK